MSGCGSSLSWVLPLRFTRYWPPSRPLDAGGEDERVPAYPQRRQGDFSLPSAAWWKSGGCGYPHPFSRRRFGRTIAAMKAKTVEDMLNDQIAACVAATEDCLAHSRLEKPDDAYGAARHHELDYVARLLKANARLTDAL